MNIKGCLVFLAFTFILHSPASSRTIGSHQEFTATVPDDFVCTDSINVNIESKTKTGFQDNPTGLSKMIGLVRMAMGFDCPQVKKINISGYHKGKQIVTSTAAKSTDWRLEPLQQTAVSESMHPSPQSSNKKIISISIPEDQMEWNTIRRNPYENNFKTILVIHNPDLLPPASKESPFANFLFNAKRQRELNGSKVFEFYLSLSNLVQDHPVQIKLAVDDTVYFDKIITSKVEKMRPRLQSSDEALLGAMLTGKKFIVQAEFRDISYALSVPLKDFKDKTALLNFNTNAIMAYNRIHNSCVQKQKKFNYFCGCVGDEFVKSIPADAQFDSFIQSKAYSNATAKCEKNLLDYPQLTDITYTELLIGARFSALPERKIPNMGMVNQLISIGKIMKHGPAYDAGLRTGEIVVSVNKSPSTNRLMGDQIINPGDFFYLKVYSPLSQKVRDVTLSARLAQPGFQELELAMYGSPLEPKLIEAAAPIAIPEPIQLVAPKPVKLPYDINKLPAELRNVKLIPFKAGTEEAQTKKSTNNSSNPNLDADCFVAAYKYARSHRFWNEIKEDIEILGYDHQNNDGKYGGTTKNFPKITQENASEMCNNKEYTTFFQDKTIRKPHGLKRAFDRLCQKMAPEAQENYDPGSSAYFDHPNICLNLDFIEKAGTSSCMSSANRFELKTPGLSAEQYCQCVGKRQAAYFATGNVSLESKTLIQTGTVARLVCDNHRDSPKLEEGYFIKK